MATRYVWKRTDVQYASSSSSSSYVYVGDKDIYGGSGYSFDA